MIMFLVLALLSGTKYEYLETYDIFGEEYAEAIKKTNELYEKAIEDAEGARTRSEYKAHLAIANHQYIERAIEIVKNCSDENNTMCKNKSNDEDYNPGNLIIAVLLFLLPVITMFALVNSK